MRLVRTAANFPFDLVSSGSVVTIGTFDGLHLGHQQLLDRVREDAKNSGLPSVVMSFEPTPKEFFMADAPPGRLTRFRDKYHAFDEAGIDVFFCPRFSSHMKEMTADTVIRQILVHTMNARQIVVGDDFRFGKGRVGNIELLRRAGKGLHFNVDQLPSVILGDERVSSTAIRTALLAGNMDIVARMLGRPYRMSGKVIEGKRLGHTLGIPTANIDPHRRQSAAMGIYAVRVSGLDDRVLDAVASIGTRPVFEGRKVLLEVHIFDFDEDIYGRSIDVDFVARLRDEENFDSVDDLITQMNRDCDQARAILASDTTGMKIEA